MAALLKTALATKDAVAVHARKDHDVFAHHVRDAPVLEAVAELTDVDADFREGPPPPDPKHIHTTLETKDHLAAHGVRLPEEEALWREELEEGVARAMGS